MTNNPDKEGKHAWRPDEYIQILKHSLQDYEKEHPHWQIEVLVSLIKRGLIGLKQHIEDPNEASTTWDNPFVELHYPVDWDWNAPRGGDLVQSKLVTGKITEQNTCDPEMARSTLAEIMVRHLNTMALQFFTNDVWFEKYKDSYTPIVPAERSDQLNAIKPKNARRVALKNLFRPFSIGAASIDFDDMELQDGVRVSKRVAEQLANIDKLIDIREIRFHEEVSGRTIEMSLIFQIHPLVVDYDKQKAFFAITVGLFMTPQVVGNDFVTTTPSDWPQNDLETLWKELLEEVKKIADHLIPKTESQTSEIFLVNAQLEIPLASSNAQKRNVAIKMILDNLSQVGQVREISVKPAETSGTTCQLKPKDVQANEDRVPSTFEEGLFLGVWKSRFRWLIMAIVMIAIVAFAVYSAQPDEVKIRILKYLGLSK